MPRAKPNQPLSEKVQYELGLVEYSDTIGGALINVESLFKKIHAIFEGTPILFHIESQIALEDQSSFENLQKSVDWVQEKIRKLLPVLLWERDSWNLNLVHALLKFEVISLSQGGYLSSLFFELKHIASDVVQNLENHYLFEGWAKIERLSSGEFSIAEWILPEYLDHEISKPPIDEQISQWQEKADTSPVTLYRFLKLLSLYSSFQPLVLSPTPSPSEVSKNLQEVEQKQYQAHVGYYLSLFKSPKKDKHPLTLKTLTRLIKRLLLMLEIESKTTTLKGPALQKYMSAAAEAYCVKELVEHVLALPPDQLKGFKRYAFEVFEHLRKKATESKQPFADHITKTMVKQGAGPQANRLLLKLHDVVWHPIPPKQGGVQSPSL